MAVSSLQCGLLPLNQTSMRFLKIAYHDYMGVVLDMAEQEVLVRDLGDSEALILRNHGLLTLGRTVGEAFNWMHRLELSCRAQIAAMSCNTPLQEVSEKVLHETYMNYQPQVRRPYGVMEWPALLRMVDRMDPSFKE
jgi:ribulose-5-phosphate 4-epimerase/fuculose-1-phosphate aldolase